VVRRGVRRSKSDEELWRLVSRLAKQIARLIRPVAHRIVATDAKQTCK
jgi:hypothetical protein